MVEPELLGELGIEEFTEEFFSDEAMQKRATVDKDVFVEVSDSDQHSSNLRNTSQGLGCILPVLLMVFILLVVVISV